MLTPLTVILVLFVLRYTVLLALLHSGVYPTRYMLTLLYPPGWSHVTDIDGDFIECTAESDVTFSGTVNKLQEFENYSADQMELPTYHQKEDQLDCLKQMESLCMHGL